VFPYLKTKEVYLKEKVRAALTNQFRQHHSIWRELNLLFAVFNVLGLVLALIAWESDKGNIKRDRFSTFTQIMVSVLAFITLVRIKYHEKIWSLYNSKGHFFRVINLNMTELDDKNVEFLSEKIMVDITSKTKQKTGV
jgi:fumarate reductase subunit C